MRNYSSDRHGFDRVLMAVAATFLAVSTTSAWAQGAPDSQGASELAIEAAIPKPEPANVPPPTAADIKATPPATQTTDSQSAATRADDKAAAQTANAPDVTKPADKSAADAKSVTETKSTAETKAASDNKPDTTASTTPTAPAAAATAPAEGTSAEPVKDQAKEQTDPARDKAPVTTASQVAPADQPVADKLHQLLDSKSAQYFDRKNERAAVEKFYAARGYGPVWTEGGVLDARAKSVIARLKDAAADGLDPEMYPVPDFAAATGPDALAEADLKLTASMLDYARQAQSGRMHWSQVSGDIQYPEHPVDPDQVLANVTEASDPSATLDAYNPPQKPYKLLKAKLAELRGQTGGPKVEIPDGPTLLVRKDAMEDPRVLQIRARLGVTENPQDAHYDQAVADAVRDFQSSHHLKPDGIFGDGTRRAMNGPSRDREINTIIVNMERWRWLPRQLGAPSLGNAYAMLNIPDYTLKVMHNGERVWKTKVVVGKPGKHATPLLTQTMKYITINPTWNVPPSIIYKEYLPALAQDPTVLERMGLKLEHGRDGSIHISQPPGDRNALGRIRFNFPNKFLVYQHDTPDKYLFAKATRAYSHGCMRVQNPDQYASILLNIGLPNDHYTPEKIRSMYGSNEHDIKFPTPIPVHITYQTAWVDGSGKLQTRSDVYGIDARMEALLHNDTKKNLEAVVAHAQPNYSFPKGNVPQGVAYNDRGSNYYDNYYGGGGDPFGNFFERLFGGPPAPPPPAEYDRRRRIYR